MTVFEIDRIAAERALEGRKKELKHTMVVIFLLRITSFILLVLFIILVAVGRGGCQKHNVTLGKGCDNAGFKNNTDQFGSCEKEPAMYSITNWISLTEKEQKNVGLAELLIADPELNITKPDDKTEEEWKKDLRVAEEKIVRAAWILKGQIIVSCIAVAMAVGTGISFFWLYAHRDGPTFVLDRLLLFPCAFLMGCFYVVELYYTYGFGHLTAWCKWLTVLCGGICDYSSRPFLIKSWGVAALFALLATFSFAMDGILVLTVLQLRKNISDMTKELAEIMKKLAIEEKEREERRKGQPEGAIQLDYESAFDPMGEFSLYSSDVSGTPSMSKKNIPHPQSIVNTLVELMPSYTKRGNEDKKNP